MDYWQITPEEYKEQEAQQIRDLESTGHFGPNYKEYIRKDGTRYPLRISGFILTDSDGKKVVWGIIEDLSKQRKAEEEIKRLAFYDTLTNLPNRRLLNDRLTSAMASSKRNACYGTLMFLDLDNFKPINDTHGHAAGDLLLIEAADRLKNCVREIDTVARFGGDEFVIIVSELDVDKIAAATQARLVAEKILASLSEPYFLAVNAADQSSSLVEHRCTASIGVAMFINHEASQDDILKWADVAMYHAKEAGRNSIRFYAS